MSPRVFNLVVDAVVREWLRQVMGAETAALGIRGDVWKFLVAFYADDGLIQARDPAFLRHAFEILVDLFGRVGLKTNTTKTKAMVCIPGGMSLLRERGEEQESMW